MSGSENRPMQVDDGTFSCRLVNDQGAPDHTYPEFWVHKNESYNPHGLEIWVTYEPAANPAEGFKRFGAQEGLDEFFTIEGIGSGVVWTPEQFKAQAIAAIGLGTGRSVAESDFKTYLIDPTDCSEGNAGAQHGLYEDGIYTVAQKIDGNDLGVTAKIWRVTLNGKAREFWLLAAGYQEPKNTGGRLPVTFKVTNVNASPGYTTLQEFQAWAAQGGWQWTRVHHGNISHS